MIIRNTRHNKQQLNWITALVDFIVVVLGVFIGFQLSSWNDHRIRKDELDGLLDGLAKEFEDRSVLLQEKIVRYSLGVQALGSFIRSIRDGKNIPEEQAIASIESVWIAEAIEPPGITFREMMEGGKFSLVGDPAIRNSLWGVQRSAESSIRIQNSLALNFSTATRAISPFLKFSYTTDAVGNGNKLLAVNQIGLWRDRSSRNGLDELFRFTNNMQFLFIYNLSVTCEALKAISQARNREKYNYKACNEVPTSDWMDKHSLMGKTG